MKTKMKKLVRLLFVFNLLILFSCQTEEEVLKTNNSQNREFVKRKISLSEINSNKISNQISKAENLKNGTITSRLANDGINDFYIETENGLYVQDQDGTESYTFAVYRDSSTINVENLVIMSYPDQEIKTFLINYNKSIEELNSMTESEIQNHTITFNEIDFETNTITTLNTSDPNARWICVDFFKWDVIPCHQGELFGDGPLYCYGWVFSYTICTPGGGGGGGSGGGSGSGGSGYGGNNHGGGGSGGSNTGTGNTGNGGVLTIPLSVEESQAKLAKIKRIKAFKVDLNLDQSVWLNALPNSDVKNNVYEYLESQISTPIDEIYLQSNVNFVKELIDLAYQNPQITNVTLLNTIQEKQNDSSLNLQQAFTLAVVNNTVNPTTGDPVELYLLLKYKNSSFFDSSSFSIINNSINVGAYTLTPHYKSNNTLVFYTAVRYSGSSTLHDIEYIIKPTGLSNFQQQISLYTYAADLFYMNGIPSDGQIALMAGDYFVGLSQMWNDAVHSPQWWAYAITCFGHAIVALPTNTTVSSTITTQQWRVSMKRLTNNAFQGKTVTNPQGVSASINIPNNYVPSITNNGQGINFRPNPSVGTHADAGLIRVMQPGYSGGVYYPKGYVVFYNNSGQAINPINNQTLSPNYWHFKFQ